jgi:adenosylcobinamide kinase/adenosylcobinamide-phosphate guanylyltransferase
MEAVELIPHPASPSRAHRTMVSGPAGSGKSRWAELLAERSGLMVIYLATGPHRPDDTDWQQRLERHRRRRPSTWHCLEVAGELGRALGQLQPGQLGLVDSLGTWVVAHLETGERDWRQRCEDLHRALQQSASPVILVCEETAWGVVPPTDLGLRFRQRLADLQRHLAADCDQAWLVLQGRALDLQAHSLPVPPDPRDA